MNKTELALVIKKKYPEYESVNDSLLVEKIINEYPEYKSLLDSNDQTEQKVNLKESLTDIIKKPVGRYLQRVKQLESDVYEQTATGEALGLKKGSVAENILGAPERTVRFGAQQLGTLGATLALPFDVGYEALEKTGIPKKISDKIANTKAGRFAVKKIEDIAKKYESLSPSAKANLNLTGAELSLIGELGGGSALRKPIEKVAKGQLVSDIGRVAKEKIIPALETKAKEVLPIQTVDKALDKGIKKGLKPTSDRIQSRYRNYQEFINQSKAGIKTMAEYKDRVKILNEAGNEIRNPQNLFEMARAVELTKKEIYKDWTDISKQAGAEGFKFNPEKILSELDNVQNNKKFNPKVRKYAEKLKDEITELSNETPDVIEARIKDLNENLVSYYSGRTKKAKAQVDASLASLLRTELDDQITNTLGQSTEYLNLRKKYRDLMNLETQVQHRAKVDSRAASKNVFDLTDVFTGGEIVSGVLTMNPALITKGVTGMGIKEFYKYLNNPNRSIKEMFNAVYGVDDLVQKQKKFLRSARSNEIKNAQNIKDYLKGVK